jgi:hypothetical protein
MPKMIFVNLPVADVAKATAFYEALGFEKNPQFSNEQASSMVWSDTIHFMLLAPDFFQTFLPEGQTIASRGTTQAIICLGQESREAVDRMAEAAHAAGGRIGFEPVGIEDPMYGRAFEDLDGHLIENMYMDLEAFTAMQAEQVAA